MLIYLDLESEKGLATRDAHVSDRARGCGSRPRPSDNWLVGTLASASWPVAFCSKICSKSPRGHALAHSSLAKAKEPTVFSQAH